MTSPAPAGVWTSADVAAAVGGRASREWQATGVSIDSRTVKPGDLFIALRGPNFDGHDFVAAALAAGAAGAIVARVPAGATANAALVTVADTMSALEALGHAARRRSSATFLAVTGSVGKTSTKEMLRLGLGTRGKTYASGGNLNNQWGVPLSLANMSRDAMFGVFELGMSHAGEIGPLSRQVRPAVAIITTVEPAHLEFFPSVEAIADAKAEIFEGMATDRVAILNRDSTHFARLAAKARNQGLTRIIGFGRHPGAEARLIDCRLNSVASEVSADILRARVTFRLNLPGLHQAMNSLAVLAAAQMVGAELGAAAGALGQLVPLEGRGQRGRVALANGSFELIDESYNASPAAVRAAFQVLGQAKPGIGGRRIAVLGDMRELGPSAAEIHAGLATDLRANGIDLVFSAGPLMAALDRALPAKMRGGHAPDSLSLIAAVVDAVRAGDVVLVKGSLGSRMAPIVAALRDLDRAGAGTTPPRAANGH
ncbi:MAG: UDP-N-acetylmuramoylalanyl-D-glutamyl-2,6-diaminopimelate--D-alanyl-D-alanine ligase [Dongiaceae bacterium]